MSAERNGPTQAAARVPAGETRPAARSRVRRVETVRIREGETDRGVSTSRVRHRAWAVITPVAESKTTWSTKRPVSDVVTASLYAPTFQISSAGLP